ncbi:MAG TPA: hypothetical protein VFS65_02270, partial [Candidatus Saccharimonadales bacterium]|nr:hypothetical protein [Candidatus Saccharimonadales bacterium]
AKVKLDSIGVGTAAPLFAQNSWNAADANRPAIMRTQMIQFGSNGFTLDGFDNKTASDQSNANTLFLYPVGNTGVKSATINTEDFVVQDVRRSPTGEPRPVTCSGLLSEGGYACRVDVRLPVPIDGGDRTAFLRLSSLYNKTHYKVTLLNGSSVVEFKAVQPAVDSTGRASDLFRRVSSRIELIDPSFPYPEAAVDITGSFCKEFAVTDNTADYATLNTNNSCQP